jgi:hypothetical protein
VLERRSIATSSCAVFFAVFAMPKIIPTPESIRLILSICVGTYKMPILLGVRILIAMHGLSAVDV